MSSVLAHAVQRAVLLTKIFQQGWQVNIAVHICSETPDCVKLFQVKHGVNFRT